MIVRTRYAPSPTGSLHIGNVRSGLFAYLFARHHGGVFILRIDDTDPQRSSKESLDEILASLGWLGIEWDEGPPDPAYFQSKRLARYQDAVRGLLSAGLAYPCYCTPEELEAKRKQAEREKRKPVYDGKCRELPFDPDLLLPQRAGVRAYAIRFRTPQHGETVVEDLVKGRAAFSNSELDDLIIFRSDGLPTYNLASVVDDIDMRITHVVRGDDHLPNTPRQIRIFEALGSKPPEFAHLPMVLGMDGKPLSKRHGATSVVAYRDAGYFPEALLNYLARLGWSHGDQEIFSKSELIEKFDFTNCGKSAGIFNPEKLLWLNFHYLKERPLVKLVDELKPFIERRGYRVPIDDGWLVMMTATLRERAKTLVELVEFARFYLSAEIEIDPKAANKFLTSQVLEPLRALTEKIDLSPSLRLLDRLFLPDQRTGDGDPHDDWLRAVEEVKRLFGPSVDEPKSDVTIAEPHFICEHMHLALHGSGDLLFTDLGYPYPEYFLSVLHHTSRIVEKLFGQVLARFNLKLGQLAQPVRVALTGGTVSPGIFEVIAVLGRQRTVERLRAAAALIEAQNQRRAE
jgi:glutamyl-tRNA synthetase